MNRSTLSATFTPTVLAFLPNRADVAILRSFAVLCYTLFVQPIVSAYRQLRDANATYAAQRHAVDEHRAFLMNPSAGRTRHLYPLPLVNLDAPLTPSIVDATPDATDYATIGWDVCETAVGATWTDGTTIEAPVTFADVADAAAALIASETAANLDTAAPEAPPVKARKPRKPSAPKASKPTVKKAPVKPSRKAEKVQAAANDGVKPKRNRKPKTSD